MNREKLKCFNYEFSKSLDLKFKLRTHEKFYMKPNFINKLRDMYIPSNLKSEFPIYFGVKHNYCNDTIKNSMVIKVCPIIPLLSLIKYKSQIINVINQQHGSYRVERIINNYSGVFVSYTFHFHIECFEYGVQEKLLFNGKKKSSLIDIPFYYTFLNKNIIDVVNQYYEYWRSLGILIPKKEQ